MSIDTDYEVLRKALEEHQPEGWAVEFGVYSGYSLNIIAEKMPVIGFDSFEGLPEDWREGFPKGMFNDAILDALPLAYMNTMLVKGWFEDTVPNFPFPNLGLVHIDCDLYSSTKTALYGVLPYISKGTIIVFDEYHGYPGWENHEAKAWEEVVHEYNLRYTLLDKGEQELAVRIDRDIR